MRMRWFLLITVLVLLTGILPAAAEVERNPLLDTAFLMLPVDDIFLARYNEITGAGIEAMFEHGMPYMFGGQDAKAILKLYPEYQKRKCWENTHFYRKDMVYVYGFDCSGYSRWIMENNGYVHPTSLSDVATHYVVYANNYVYTTNSHCTHLQPDWSEVAATLEIGDLYVIHHGGRHVLMYIGTLSDYGFTAEEVPELADYLEYPLVIHCGPSPVYGAVFADVIANTSYLSNCQVTDGGVQVSILGVPESAAPCHEHIQIHDYDYFKIGEQIITVYKTDDYSSYSWFRCDKK